MREYCQTAKAKRTSKAVNASLEKKRLQIAALQSPIESNTTVNSEGEPPMHVQELPQLCVEIPVNQGSTLSSNLVKFRKAILETPSNKCFSCKELHYGRLSGTIAWDEAGKMLEVVNLSGG